MGVPVRLILHSTPLTAERAARAAFARVASLDRMMSDYRDDSELRAIERHSGEFVRVSRELLEVLQRALRIAEDTEGAFDPTVGPYVALWREARRTGRMPDPRALAAARWVTGWRHVDIDENHSSIRLARPGMKLDLGGIAKGYILEKALRTLRAEGVTRALVEAGGDIVVGDPPLGRAGWTIDTLGANETFTAHASRLTNAALASSGATFQFAEIQGIRYSHIVDPRTGLGVTTPRIARVIAADAATADALATALTVLEPDDARAVLRRFPGVRVSVSVSHQSIEAEVVRMGSGDSSNMNAGGTSVGTSNSFSNTTSPAPSIPTSPSSSPKRTSR
jgi:thiamine biosynthesis lipoprotein